MDAILENLFLKLKSKESLKQQLNYLKQQPLHVSSQILFQINCLAFINSEVKDFLVETSADLIFYFKNRYLMDFLIDSTDKNKTKLLSEISNKMDNNFVNNPSKIKLEIKQEELYKLKVIRSELLEDFKQFIKSLIALTVELKQIKDLEIEGDEFFRNSLNNINSFLAEKCIRDKDNSLYCNQELIYKLSIIYRNEQHFVTEIISENSRYIKTKNRMPLVLDFKFSKFIFKVDNLMRNQLVANHLIKFLSQKLDFLPIVHFEIIPLSDGAALYEFVNDALTICQIKKEFKTQQNSGGIKEYFQSLGHIEEIQKTFCESYVGFAMIQYILRLGDRHNENIMITKDGKIFHIDLPYIFNSKVGHGFQSAPFKMTKQFINLLGGFKSDNFYYFQSLLIKSFTKILDHLGELLVRLSILSQVQTLKCFEKFDIKKYRDLFPKNAKEIPDFVQNLITESQNNWRTIKYDQYQFKTNGILQ